MLETVGAMPSLDCHGIYEVGKEVPTYPTYNVFVLSDLHWALLLLPQAANANNIDTSRSSANIFFPSCINSNPPI